MTTLRTQRNASTSAPLRRGAAACLSLASLALALVTSACASRGTQPRGLPERAPGYITHAMVEAAVEAGARTALDVVRFHPRPGVRIEGGPGTIRQARSSPYGPSGGRLLLVVDGARSSDLAWLREIDSTSVRDLRVLTPGQASIRFGVRGSAGAIVLRTVDR